MNKRELNRQKGKLKKINDFRWIRYARYMCVVMVVLFLFYFSILVMSNKGDIAGLFKDNLFVTVGFVICACNLFIWNELKIIHKNLMDYSCVDTNKMKLILITITEIILFNFATSILIIISLIKYFKWDGFNEIIKEIKMQHKAKSILLLLIVLIIFILLIYTILFTALTI